MPKKKIRPPFGLVIAAVLMVAWGWIYASFILTTIPVKAQINNVILTAIPFISYFVAILLIYIFIINVVSQILSNRISEKIYKPINALAIAGIIIGVIMMLQPFSLEVYQTSFVVVFASLLTFMLWSHIHPRRKAEELEE